MDISILRLPAADGVEIRFFNPDTKEIIRFEVDTFLYNIDNLKANEFIDILLELTKKV
jgi:hypothetical protein